MQEIVDAINQYGVPTVVAVGMAYFIYYIWKYVTSTILPSLNEASSTHKDKMRLAMWNRGK